MRISLKAVVRLQKQRKDKTIPVYIRIGWQSKYAFIATDYSVKKNEINKSGEIKNTIITDRCNEIISGYRTLLSDIPNKEDLDVQQIIVKLKKMLDNKGSKSVDFIAFFDRLIEKLRRDSSPSVQIYRATYNHLVKFNNSNVLDIKNITPKYLSDFEQYLKSNDVGSRGQNLYLGKIRGVFNLIIDEYEHLGYTFSYPFRKYKLPKVKTPPTIALSKDVLKRIIDIDLSKHERAYKARSAFVISLFTLGTNATDLYDLGRIKDGRIEYKRNKTKTRRMDEAFISIKVEPELEPYLVELIGTEPYLLKFREWYSNKAQFNKGISMGLKKVAELLDIPPFDFYDARRTIASVMYNRLNISKDHVAFCLNHTDISHKTTDFYIETDFSILDMCNRKFLDWLVDT